MFYLKFLSLILFLLIVSFSYAGSIFIKSDKAVIEVSDDDDNFFEDKEFFKDDDDEDEDETEIRKNHSGKKTEILEGESCGLNIKDKDIKNSVIKNEVIINGKRVNKSCFKNGSSSVNMGISIEGGAKIKNSVIENKSVIKDSEIIINGKRVVK